MAEIYRAKTQDAEGRVHLVAVKRVLGHLCEDDEFIQMLVDEAKLTALLQHENIARIYEFCRAEQEYFIAMEYVDGKDLRALLEKVRQHQDSIPVEHLAWIGIHVARALHAAHTQRDRDGHPLRIVHRDVSPSNVLLSYRGEVKLCDFGIAKATLTRVQTKTGVIKGKVKYMSPEQAMGRKLDHRSDIFSLGTLLYEMLTLQAPFQAPTEIELIFAVRDARKRPIRSFRPNTAAALEEIVDRCMARSRSQRFQSGEELAQALEAFLQEQHPNYKRSNFGRYMRTLFAREIERELRQLEDYVISSGRPSDVGENLIAEALGPDAPYTRFTAAFVDGRDLNLAEFGAPVPDEDVGDQQTGPIQGHKLPEPPPPQPPAPRRTALNFRSHLDAGWERDDPDAATTIEQQRHSAAPAPPADAAERPADAAESFLAEENIHVEQTRIIHREALDDQRGAPRVPIDHDAATRIFDIRNLPPEQQRALQGGAPARGGPQLAPMVSRQPSAPLLRPALGNELLADPELHEADTMFLKKSDIERLSGPTKPAAPADPSSVILDEQDLVPVE